MISQVSRQWLVLFYLAPLISGGMDDVVHGTLFKYTSGFVGCISNITLGEDYELNLMKEADDGSNISRCTRNDRDNSEVIVRTEDNNNSIERS